VIRAGTILEGRYRVDAQVGSGGFCTVHGGEHLTLGMRVAIKVLRLAEDMPADVRAELLSAFMDEARLVTRLRHDHIVRTLDQGVVEGTPYVVLEWCGDESLKGLLTRRGSGLPLPAAYSLIDAITAAMAHAHAQGIVHRDLKPSNVMLARAHDGELVPRVIDFGIAKLFEEETRDTSGKTLTATGGKYTPAYAAPEQLAGLRTGPWTDVHAIGLLFVELLTGRSPFGQSRLGAIDPERPTPRTFGLDCGAFDPVIARALALRAPERYADAGALHLALREAAAAMKLVPGKVKTSLPPVPIDLPDPAATEAPISRTMRAASASPPSKRTTRAWMVIAPVVVALVGGAAVWRPWRAKPSPATARAHEVVPRPMPRVTHLSEMTLARLHRRVEDAGLTVTGRGEQTDPTWMIFVHYEGKGERGTAYVNRVLLPPSLPPESAELLTLPTIKAWIEFDRAQELELAYGIEGPYVLSLTGKAQDSTLAIFDQLGAGLSLSLRGSSFGHPDPASDANDAKPLWRATSLADLSLAELGSRLRAAGLTVGAPNMTHKRWTVPLGKMHIDVFRDGEVDPSVQKKPFAIVRAGAIAVVLHGPGSSHELLAQVLRGLV
jgi:serine/threonine protein kinase